MNVYVQCGGLVQQPRGEEVEARAAENLREGGLPDGPMSH